MAIKLVLVRHGLSSFNAKGLIQGRTDDSLLTDEGYEQAQKAGKALSKINFNKIYSSPLVRAAETAKTIKKTFNKEQNIVFDDNLLEVDLSEWSGLKIDEILGEKKPTPPATLEIDGITWTFTRERDANDDPIYTDGENEKVIKAK